MMSKRQIGEEVLDRLPLYNVGERFNQMYERCSFHRRCKYSGDCSTCKEIIDYMIDNYSKESKS